VKRIALAIMLTAWSAALTACGGGNASSSNSSAASGGGSAACPAGSGTDGGGAKVSIGSKGFAEEQLLAEITKLELEKHNFTVDYSLQAKDTAIGQALSSGQIDLLWQYTGTELQTYLKLTTFPKDLDGAFAFVAQQDEPKGLCWTSKAPMNDTNGLAIKSSDRSKYGDTLSAFGTYLAAHPETKVCIMSEFRTRPDGLPGLVSTYNASYGAASLVDIGGTAE
jgi:osmoprotectant transport system substrate-binding protein